MTPRRSLAVCLLIASALIGCRSSSHAKTGAGIGALTGAVAGAAIGDHNGNAGTGALVGTAVGALTGAAIGDGLDAEAARTEALVEQQMGRQLANAVTVNDVVSMTQAGLSDQLIVNHIHVKGVATPPVVQDLLVMKNYGVSDQVISAMQQTPPPALPVAAAPPPPAAPPVIVEKHFVGPPVFWGPHYRGRPRRAHRRRPRSGFSLTIHK